MIDIADFKFDVRFYIVNRCNSVIQFSEYNWLYAFKLINFRKLVDYCRHIVTTVTNVEKRKSYLESAMSITYKLKFNII